MRRAGRRRRHRRRRRRAGRGTARPPHLPARGDRLARRPADARRASRRSTSTSTSRASAARRATTRCAMRLRDHYRGACRRGRQRDPTSIPGDCWVTRLAFEPACRREAMRRLLAPHVASGRLSVLLRTQDRRRRRRGRSHPLADCARASIDRRRIRFRPALVIDATELGDLLPLSGAEHASAPRPSAETGEAHAQPHEPSRTACRASPTPSPSSAGPPGEHHVIPEPEKYEHYRAAQPY